MRNSLLPPFRFTGRVHVFEHGSWNPMTTLEVSCYGNNNYEAQGALMRSAKWILERLGTPTSKFDSEIFLENAGITAVTALEPRGVRRNGDEKIEAFFDSPDLGKRRDVLIRQRRLVPWDLDDARAIYIQPTKPAAATQPAEEAHA